MTESRPSLQGGDASVRAVRRAIAILRAFGPADRFLPLGEIARRADLDKATSRRLLRTLIADHLIRQHTVTREYSVWLGVLELAVGATEANELRRRAQSLLAALVEATRTSAAYLVVPHAGGALCIEAVEGERPIPAAWVIGERRLLKGCAAGRVLMAYLPPDQRLSAPPGVLPAPADPAPLASRLDTIRAREWEIGLGEAVPGVADLALPVRDESGEVIAALGIAGPREDMLDGEQPRHLDAVRGTVRELERRLSAPSPVPGKGWRAH